MALEYIDLGFRPRSWQAQACLGLMRSSVLVAHRGSGKTIIAIMRLVDAALRFEGDRGRFAYIAPFLKQAKDIAWQFLREYGLKVTGAKHNESELWIEFPNGARVRLYGADYPDSFRGLHFDGVVVDEVAQMRREIWTMVLLPGLARRHGWVLFIGTPNGVNLFSELYYGALSNPAEWYCRKYAVYDTGIFTPAEIEELRRTMGERAFRQEMLCDFMASSDDTLISIEDATASSRRIVPESEYAWAPRILGVDIAWAGGDRSVICPRQGLMAFEPKVVQGLPEKQFASMVGHAIDTWKADACFVDVTGGYGGEVVSRLTDLGYRPQRVVFSAKPANPRFGNLRAEMWFKMADWIKEGGCLPPGNSGLIAELCAPTYTNDNASNRLFLESKEDVKAKLGLSPDIADSLAITFAYPVASHGDPKSMRYSFPKPKGRSADFDPLSPDRAYSPRRDGRGSDFDPFGGRGM